MKSAKQYQLEDEINELRYECHDRDNELESLWDRLNDLEDQLTLLIMEEHNKDIINEDS